MYWRADVFNKNARSPHEYWLFHYCLSVIPTNIPTGRAAGHFSTPLGQRFMRRSIRLSGRTRYTARTPPEPCSTAYPSPLWSLKPLALFGGSVPPVCSQATVARRTMSAMPAASGMVSSWTFSMGILCTLVKRCFSPCLVAVLIVVVVKRRKCSHSHGIVGKTF